MAGEDVGRHVLLLVGSPKPSESTSEALGSHILNRLSQKGFSTTTVNLPRCLKSEKEIDDLYREWQKATLIVLAFPLYIDSLPWPVVKAFELLNERFAGNIESNRKGFVVVVNSGFPEQAHNTLAVEMCRFFAVKTGLEWKGGLALGGGPMVQGQSLNGAHGPLKRLMDALDMTSESLASGGSVPAEASQLLSRPLIPRGLYLLMGSHGWKTWAKSNGVKQRMYDQPFLHRDLMDKTVRKV